MFNITRSKVGIGLAASLVIASAVGVTSMTSANQVVTAPPSTPYGTLTLDLTDRAGTLTFVPAAGGPAYIQPLRTQTPCSTVVSDPITRGSVAFEGDLLSFGATGGTNPNPQLPSSAIGVTDGANCGEPAGLIGPGETLTLTLGNFFPADVSIGNGSLNIGKSRQPDGNLQLRYDDSTTFTDVVPPVAVGGSLVPVGTNFTSIELRSTANQSSRGLSLRGGTVFNLVTPSEFDAGVLCGRDHTVTGTTELAATSARFERLPNEEKTDDDPDCEDIGVTIDIRTDNVFWDNSATGFTGTPQNVRALVTIEWAPVGVENLDEELEIDYENDGTFVLAEWCDSYRVVDGEVEATLPSGVPWCLVSSSSEVDADGNIVRTTVFYGAGDPVGRWS